MHINKYINELDLSEPPLPPPVRILRETWWIGGAETEESKQNTKDWREYISLYGYLLKQSRMR